MITANAQYSQLEESVATSPYVLTFLDVTGVREWCVQKSVAVGVCPCTAVLPSHIGVAMQVPSGRRVVSHSMLQPTIN